MKRVLFAVLLVLAPAAVSLASEGAGKPAKAGAGVVGSRWVVRAYASTAGAVSAWSDDEAKAILQKDLVFERGAVRLGKEKCKSVVAEVPAKQVSELGLLSGLNASGKCGAAKAAGPVYSVDLQCGDKVRFTPYLVRLADGSAIGFGDAIEFCLAPAGH